MTSLESDLVRETIGMQQRIQRAINLAIVVLRGPNKQMRDEALDELAKIAEAIGESNARLEELL